MLTGFFATVFVQCIHNRPFFFPTVFVQCIHNRPFFVAIVDI